MFAPYVKKKYIKKWLPSHFMIFFLLFFFNPKKVGVIFQYWIIFVNFHRISKHFENTVFHTPNQPCLFVLGDFKLTIRKQIYNTHI